MVLRRVIALGCCIALPQSAQADHMLSLGPVVLVKPNQLSQSTETLTQSGGLIAYSYDRSDWTLGAFLHASFITQRDGRGEVGFSLFSETSLGPPWLPRIGFAFGAITELGRKEKPQTGFATHCWFHAGVAPFVGAQWLTRDAWSVTIGISAPLPIVKF